jgi:hypothetical protein
VKLWLESAGTGCEPVMDSCEYGNRPPVKLGVGGEVHDLNELLLNKDSTLRN